MNVPDADQSEFCEGQNDERQQDCDERANPELPNVVVFKQRCTPFDHVSIVVAASCLFDEAKFPVDAQLEQQRQKDDQESGQAMTDQSWMG